MHFSLDMWNTLIIPNKEYSKIRNRILATRLGITEEFATLIYNEAKASLDKEAEEHGIGYNSDMVYERLNNICSEKLHEDIENIRIKLNGIRATFESEFIKNPPAIPDQSIKAIRELTKLGHTFSIGSNTNFIRGEVLRSFLRRIGIPISYYVFSDEFEVSKPNPIFFRKIITNMQVIGKPIVHIGDNPICDNSGDFCPHTIIKNPKELAFALYGVIHNV